MWIFLWRGNLFIARALERKYSWLRQPIQRFIAGMLGTVVYTGGAIFLIMFFFRAVFDYDLGDSFMSTIIISIILTIIISLFMHSREFLLNWRKLELDAVQLRNENLSSKYESLKSQLDPHFLFNSLNVLTNLVYQDADRSAMFIKQLSEVYRYVLEVKAKELVPLADELQFVESYLYLQKIRFGEKLIVQNQLNGKDVLVPPLALQLLVENAIKHNVISEADPLRIEMYRQDSFLVVKNNLQKKEVIKSDNMTSIGLDNIQKRYEFLTNQKIQIVETAQTFLVKLPCIENS